MAAVKFTSYHIFAHLIQVVTAEKLHIKDSVFLFLSITYTSHIVASCCVGLQNMRSVSFGIWELQMVCGWSTPWALCCILQAVPEQFL